jgi:hypothetical protein
MLSSILIKYNELNTLCPPARLDASSLVHAPRVRRTFREEGEERRGGRAIPCAGMDA